MSSLLDKIIRIFHKPKPKPEPRSEPEPLLQTVRKWFINPVGMADHGICRALSVHVINQTGIVARVYMSDAFLKKYYVEYSGFRVHPVPSPTTRDPGVTFMSTEDYVYGPYGKSRMALFNVLNEHTPILHTHDNKITIAWVCEEELDLIPSYSRVNNDEPCTQTVR